MKTLAIVSLGCFRNTYDSQVVLKRFLDQGYSLLSQISLVDPAARCDTLLINTCGFIDKAKQETIQCIRDAVALKKKGNIKKLIVFGCLVQRYRKDLQRSFPQVDQWQGVERFDLASCHENTLLPRHIGFLKICDGCINRCSYCAIPLIKGGLISKPAQEIIKEAQYLDKNGVKELHIIGQDTTSWGADLAGRPDLARLLKSIIKATKHIRWIRLLYTHPRHFTNSLLDVIAQEERICKYIDLPIQHINDRILKLMARGVTKQEIVSLIAKIRKNVRNCSLRTSVIAGFPTESKIEFKELLSFIKETEFEKLGAFVYSREEGTLAYNFKPQVHSKTKESRYREIMRVQQEISARLGRRYIGKSLPILVDGKEDGVYIARTQYDAYEVDGVVYLGRKNIKVGEFYTACITDAYEYDLVGV
ncbi:MAG: MiaB/RimO family radical SAM methylthiotransferase [Candidatus Omnitrophota bacterium]